MFVQTQVKLVEKDNEFIEAGKTLNTAQVFFLSNLAERTNYACELLLLECT